MKARVWFGRGAALAAMTVSIVAVAATPGAVATQGQPVIAGQVNDETTETVIRNPSFGSSSGCDGGGSRGIVGCGGTGVVGIGGVWGVSGEGETYGVIGHGASGATGVFGYHAGTTGIGVWGRTGGVGSAVYGQATAGGVGVNGYSASGSGVRASTASGKALEVIGKATFSRSGIVTVSAGTSSKTVTLAGVTTASMVMATIQQKLGTSSIAVKWAVPAAGSFTIYLTGNAPAGGAKVAYFVLN